MPKVKKEKETEEDAQGFKLLELTRNLMLGMFQKTQQILLANKDRENRNLLPRLYAKRTTCGISRKQWMRTYTFRLYSRIYRLLESGKTPKDIARQLDSSISLVYIARFRLSRLKRRKQRPKIFPREL
jgi:hypothetical protein